MSSPIPPVLHPERSPETLFQQPVAPPPLVAQTPCTDGRPVGWPSELAVVAVNLHELYLELTCLCPISASLGCF